MCRSDPVRHILTLFRLVFSRFLPWASPGPSADPPGRPVSKNSVRYRLDRVSVDAGKHRKFQPLPEPFLTPFSRRLPRPNRLDDTPCPLRPVPTPPILPPSRTVSLAASLACNVEFGFFLLSALPPLSSTERFAIQPSDTVSSRTCRLPLSRMHSVEKKEGARSVCRLVNPTKHSFTLTRLPIHTTTLPCPPFCSTSATAPPPSAP